MLASTPSPHYLPPFSRDSPSYQPAFAMASTPPRFKSESMSPFHSPMLTPSPLKTRNTMDPDDVFLHSPSTSILAARRSHPISPPFTTSIPLRTPVKESYKSEDSGSPVGVGAKRKPAPLTLNTATPLRKRTITPLKTAAISTRASMESFTLERLAPLTAPRFSVTRTPQSKAETDIALKRQAETLKKLKICDLDLSEDDSDSGGLAQARLFLNRDDEVATNISPGGHVTKRRIKSRPVSSELLEDATDSPFIVKPAPRPRTTKRPPVGPIAFPTSFRSRTSSASSSSDCASPVPPHRALAGAGPRSRTRSQSAVRPFNRHASNSSASLFFGPSIPDPKDHSSDTASLRSNMDTLRTQPKFVNRHSYAGSETNWSTSSRSPHLPSFGEDDAEDFFAPSDSSFAFTIMDSSPNSRSRISGDQKLPMKYKPRDSGVSFEDGDDNSGHTYPPVMPAASTSVSTIYSEDEGLVTPIFSPGRRSGWPVPDNVTIINPDDDVSMGMPSSASSSLLSASPDVDGFIMRLLVGGGNSKDHDPKKMPGTPVKKVKTAHFAVERPWASAFTNKIGSEEFDYLAPPPAKDNKGKKPRKSLPAAFPMLLRSGGDEDSPTERKEIKYSGLGLGRPTERAKGGRTHWLMRRSSSGVFSSGIENSARPVPSSPTRLKGTGNFKLPPPRIPAQFSPLNKNLRIASDQRSISSSSTSTSTVNSPTSPRFYHPTASVKRRNGPSPFKPRYSNVTVSSDERPGKFEADFAVIDDDLGSGEFGRVLKVRRIVADDEEFISMTSKDENVFAVKKSKPMEGVKHRLRLREEVDVLRHLSQASLGGRGHPNVLGYVDSWEQDGVLFIQTELCELGSFGRFLWEYGRVFPRLDEARVWKILADLSNGMLFIHDNGIIHLDLKPANIFINGDGRFKIGDFGMASVWPRVAADGFEREGDKEYMAPEVLQGKYGKAADIFGFGMTMLETAANIVVPGQGDAWHRLRQENFEQVDMDDSPELFELIKSMMRTNCALRVNINYIHSHPIVTRTRAAMESMVASSGSVFAGSPLASVPNSFLREILNRDDDAMDLSP